MKVTQSFRQIMVDIAQKTQLTNAAPTSLQFVKAKHGEFIQDQPKLHNPYSIDGPLKRYLKRLLPPNVSQSNSCIFTALQ